MPQDFYDLDSARKLHEWVKNKLREIEELSLEGKKAMSENDLEWADSLTLRVHAILDEIGDKGIIVRDQDVTLIDIPAVINNIPSYFCWKPDENEILFWHYADEGFAGRKKIDGTEQILSYL